MPAEFDWENKWAVNGRGEIIKRGNNNEKN